jgi:translation initiation factor 1
MNTFKEIIRLRIERQGRRGKTVTVAEGFTRHLSDLETIAKRLKQSCGTGGTVRWGIIELQGDHRDRIRPVLQQEGFEVKG